MGTGAHIHRQKHIHHIHIFKSWARWHMLIILELGRQSQDPGAWWTASLDSWWVPGQWEILSHEAAAMPSLHTQAPANTRAFTWIHTKETENIKMSGQVPPGISSKMAKPILSETPSENQFKGAEDGLADSNSFTASLPLYLLSLLCLLHAEFPADARTCLYSGNGRQCYKTFISNLFSNLIFL